MNGKSIIFRKLRWFIRHDKGAALAELAILVPFLVLLMAAVSEFGRFFQKYTTLSKSTRTAARYLSNHPFPTSQNTARNLVVCGKLTCNGNDALVSGLTTANVCIKSTASPKIETMTVNIPRAGRARCGPPLNSQPHC